MFGLFLASSPAYCDSAIARMCYALFCDCAVAAGGGLVKRWPLARFLYGGTEDVCSAGGYDLGGRILATQVRVGSLKMTGS